MVIAETLSRSIPEILTDISIKHVYIKAERKQDYQLANQDDLLQCTLAHMIITGQTDDIIDALESL